MPARGPYISPYVWTHHNLADRYYCWNILKSDHCDQLCKILRRSIQRLPGGGGLNSRVFNEKKFWHLPCRAATLHCCTASPVTDSQMKKRYTNTSVDSDFNFKCGCGELWHFPNDILTNTFAESNWNKIVDSFFRFVTCTCSNTMFTNACTISVIYIWLVSKRQVIADLLRAVMKKKFFSPIEVK